MCKRKILKSAKKFLAWFLCAALLADSGAVRSMAANESEVLCEAATSGGEAVDPQTADTSTADGADSSLGRTEDPEAAAGQDGADSTLGGSEDAALQDGAAVPAAGEAVASGSSYGVEWSLDASGLLSISGTAESRFDGFLLSEGWKDYRGQITSVRFTAQNLPNMRYLFKNCTNLQSVDLSDWDLDGVTNAEQMFDDCENLKSVTIGTHDLQKLTDVRAMFGGCSSLERVDFSGCTFDKMENFLNMFSECGQLKSVTFGRLRLDQVKSLGGMFYNCASLKTLDIDQWTISHVTDTVSMFYGCSSLERLNLSGLDLGSVNSMRYMFGGCEQLKSIQFGSQTIGAVTGIDGMLENCYALTELDLSTFDLSGVTSYPCDNLLKDCLSLTRIKTPKTTSQRIDLFMLMQDSTGKFYEKIPNDTSAGILLTKYAPDKTTVVASGNYRGMEWVIKGDGALTISGTLDGTESYEWWDDWKCFVTSAKIISSDLKAKGNYLSKDAFGYFEGCSELQSVDLSECSLANITDLSRMFYECRKLQSVNFGNADTRNVKNMSYMFYCCEGLKSIDLSSLDTGSVENMSDMFTSCKQLESIIWGEHFSTKNVKDMSWMFSGCSKLVSLDLTHFDVGNVENIHNMFVWCTGLTDLDISRWNAKNLKRMNRIFCYCRKLKTVDVSGWNTSKVTDMSDVFNDCRNLTAVDVSGWDTQNVRDMNYMFAFCEKLTTVDVSGWDTSKVTDMHWMFCSCTGLKTLDVSGWNTQNVKNMNDLFGACYELAALDVSGWDTSNVTDMSYMFSSCKKVPKLDVSGWNTSNVEKMNGMFGDCVSLEALELNRWNIGKVTNLGYFLSECNSIRTLDLSNWDLSAVTSATNLVACKELQTLKTPTNVRITVFLPCTMYDSKGKAYTTLPQGSKTSVTLTRTKGQGGNDKPEVVLPKLEIALADADNEFTYNGSAFYPAVTVVVEGKTLTAGVDYTVKYSNNVNASVKVNGDGTLAVGQDGAYIAASAKRPTVTVTAKGNYSGSASAYFTILPKDLSEVCPGGMELKAEEGTKPAVTLWDGGVKLAAKDYVLKNGSADSSTVYKPAAVKAGETLNLTAVGKANYMGTAAITVTCVAKKSLNPITVTPVKTFKGFEYNGESRKPVFGGAEGKNDADEDVQVVVSSKTAPKTEEGGKGLVEGEDYYVLYSADTTNAGTVKYTVVGMGDYTGSISKSYKINPIKAKSGLKLEYDKTKSYPFAPAGAVVDDIAVTFDNASSDASTNALLNGEELTEGKDYKISYSANKKAGTGKFTVTFLGNYKGSAALKNNEFTIRPVSFAELAEQGRVKVLLADKTAAKNGVYKSAPVITVDDVLVKASNYTVTYYTDEAMTTLMDKKNGKELEFSAEKPSATVWVKIEGKGNYAGSASGDATGVLSELYGEKLCYTVYKPDGKTTGDMGAAKLALTVKSYPYIGSPICPEKSNFTVTCKVNGETVTLDESQYDVTYINNVNRGKATVLITGNGESGTSNQYTFVGSKTATFTIAIKKVR